jgi:1-acyl-sn-glycerol-3-phosphate acyltransferase
MTYSVYRALAPIICPRFRKKITSLSGIEHLPSGDGFIIACNHVDWLDGFYLIAVTHLYRHLPIHFLTKSNNYWWTGIAVQIPDDRSAIIDAAVGQLRSGEGICNFPEGERNDTPRLTPGKTGTVRMAAEAGVPVIPAGITCDAGRNMGQSIRFLLSSHHPVQLRFGAPLTFPIPRQGITSEWLTAETDRLMRAIAPLADKSV